MKDPYSDLIDEEWHSITKMYHMFRKKKPIMLYNIDEQKLYSYPARKYINTLSEKTRTITQKNYSKACKNNNFILFIMDKKNQVFRSYVFPIAE